jgi:membrane protein
MNRVRVSRALFILSAMIFRLLTFAQALWQRLQKARLGMAAASMAFFGFLALFPGATMVVALWGLASDPDFVTRQAAPLKNILPPEAFALLSDQLHALALAPAPDLRLTTLISLALALWSARAGASALISALNAVHHLPDLSGPKHEALALGLTLLLVCLTLLSLLIAVFAPLVIALLPLGPVGRLLLQFGNVILALLLSIFALAFVYRLGPNLPRAGRRGFLTPGLWVGFALWLVISRLFAEYLANFGSYNKIYGSIGAVAALLMWFYFSAYAMLLGAAVDAERAARRRLRGQAPEAPH